MIIKTTKTINGIECDYTYSDSRFMIERDGVQYEDAVDPLNSGRIYTETDVPIDGHQGDDIDDSEAFDIIFGG